MVDVEVERIPNTAGNVPASKRKHNEVVEWMGKAFYGDGTCSETNVSASCFAALHCAEDGQVFRGTKQHVRKQLRSSRNVFFAARREGRLAGVAMVERSRAGLVKLWNFCVSHEVRRTGVGAALVRHVLETYRSQGVELSVAKPPTAAAAAGDTGRAELHRRYDDTLKFYRRFGFRVSAETPSVTLMRLAPANGGVDAPPPATVRVGQTWRSKRTPRVVWTVSAIRGKRATLSNPAYVLDETPLLSELLRPGSKWSNLS